MTQAINIATGTADLNQALYSITHGLYILTAFANGRPNGQCLDSLMQVTSVPPRIAIGVGKRNLTHEMILESGSFAVNVLDRADPLWMDKVKRFGFQSGRKADKFEGIPYERSENGSPVLADTRAFYECSILPDKTIDLETHSLFIADVKRAGVCGQCEPVTYNEYRRLKRT